MLSASQRSSFLIKLLVLIAYSRYIIYTLNRSKRFITGMSIKYTITELLKDKWWIGIVALAISLIATPIVRYIAYRTKIVDKPDDLLKPHGRPIAYLGGLAMCIGFLAGLAVYVLVIMPDLKGQWQEIGNSIINRKAYALLTNPLWQLFGVAAASITITIVGLADDLWNITPRKKVLGQMLAASLLIAGGVGFRMAKIVFMSLHVDVPSHWVLVPLSIPIAFVLVVATCNATNLLDGLDGLCGGVTAIITIGFLGLSVFLATWGRNPDLDELRIVLCLAMAGAVLGFLPYNVPPASIFMGDAGSMLLGLFVAAMMAFFCLEGTARWFIAACAVFALPILDTALAVVRRLLSGKGVFEGDRSHLYDQLVDRGMSVKQVVVLFYVLATLAAVIGVVVAVKLKTRYAVIIYAALLVIIWAIFFKLGMVTPPPKGLSDKTKADD